MDGRDLAKVIMEYGASASGKKGIECTVGACPLCHRRQVGFRRHGVRKRLFLVFARVVREVWSCLPRWKCPSCRGTFTQYPPFALPFKRYALPFIVERAASYVTDEARPYAEGVAAEGVPVCHEDAEAGQSLWPSTLWRWVRTLGGFPETVRRALDLIKQKDPSTDIVRRLSGGRLRAEKYRSTARGKVLHCCRALVLAAPFYARLFGVGIFPDLATGVGWK